MAMRRAVSLKPWGHRTPGLGSGTKIALVILGLGLVWLAMYIVGLMLFGGVEFLGQ